MVNAIRRITITVAFIMIFAVSFSAISAYDASAATKGSISSVSNVTAGIKVCWNKYSGRDGYVIYKKVGTGSWTKAVKIKGSSTLNWTDSNTVDGKKYTYKVYTYKGSNVYSNSVTKKTYRVSKPTVSLASTFAGELTVRTDNNDAATGYKVMYTKDSDFSSYSSKYVTAKELDKTIGNLTTGCKYYVKVQAYKTVSGVKYYSYKSSKKYKTVRNSHAAYLTGQETRLKLSQSSSASYVTVPYMEEITVVQNVSATTSGSWYMIKYDGKPYYLWVDKGTEKFTNDKSSFTYAAFNSSEQKIVDNALLIRNSDTVYYKSGTVASGTLTAEGMAFDCSGFVRYVYSKALGYALPKTANDIWKLTSVNNHLIKSICKGSWDISSLHAGDIIFFDESNSGKCTHVGIYLGNNEFVHCVKSYGVTISPMQGCWERYFMEVKRFI